MAIIIIAVYVTQMTVLSMHVKLDKPIVEEQVRLLTFEIYPTNPQHFLSLLHKVVFENDYG